MRRKLDDGRAFTTEELTGAVTDEAYHLDLDMLPVGLGKADLHIIPAVGGEGGRGLGKVVMGVALIAGAWALAPVALGGAAGAGIVGGHVMSATAVSLMGMNVTFGQIALYGAIMALGGVSTMLAKPPQAAAPKDSQDSYIFSGPANVSSQYNPVPVVHGGPIRVGSVTISSAVTNERVSSSFGGGSSVGGGGTVAGGYSDTGAIEVSV